MKLDFNRRYTTIAFYAFLVLSGAGLFAAFLQNFPFFKGFFLQIFTLLRPFLGVIFPASQEGLLQFV